MKIQKIKGNKRMGIASVGLGVFVLITASNTFEYFSGGFVFTVGLALWWINR